MAPKNQKQKPAIVGDAASKKPVAGSIKAANNKKKSTFKPILENPFTKVSWPEISAENGKLFIKLLKNAIDTQISLAKDSLHLDKAEISKPRGESSLIYGLNAVTAALEAQAQIVYQRVNQCARKIDYSDIVYTNPICAVFVCRSDFSFPLLIAHLPMLCSAASYYPGRAQSPQVKGSGRLLEWGDYTQTVKLIKLPPGATQELTVSISEGGSTVQQHTKKRRRKTSLCKNSFGIIALRRDAAGAKHLLDLVCKKDASNQIAPSIEIPWFDDFKKVALSELPSNQRLKLNQPNVKFVGSVNQVQQPPTKRKKSP